MTKEYTPTTEDIRSAFAEGMAEAAPFGVPWEEAIDESRKLFDRWLDAHDAEVRES